MKWKKSKWIEKWFVKRHQLIIEWHRWFAWYPISIQENRFWLCYVERIGKRAEGYDNDGLSIIRRIWEYRNLN
uniref:Uncharacterized protein n=1 Tax=viral metagenome TaxID=1070528 RepID=A0A6M3IMD2_9ZZZZ